MRHAAQAGASAAGGWKIASAGFRNRLAAGCLQRSLPPVPALGNANAAPQLDFSPTVL